MKKTFHLFFCFANLIFISHFTFADDNFQVGVDEIKNTVGRSNVSISQSNKTNYASFVRFKTPHLPQNASLVAKQNIESIAHNFIHQNHKLFLSQNITLDLVTTAISENDNLNMSHVKMQQFIHKIPVRGAEIIVHMNNARITSASSKIVSSLNRLNFNTSLSSDIAISRAELLMLQQLKLRGLAEDLNLTYSQPRLEIYSKGIFRRNYPIDDIHITWFIESRNDQVWEMIWIDAHTGKVIDHINQITDSKNRNTYDCHSTTDCTSLIRTEGSSDVGDSDIDNAHNYAGDTYDFFYDSFSRDSYDNAGAELKSKVKYCPNNTDCPYANAYWNGIEITYGLGFSDADDVVAHELTHAITQYTANLVYQDESGALNESFSDIFGESVDLLNTGGTDTEEVRWDMGEDVPGNGALRDMMDPNRFNDPEKVSDPLYYCGTSDYGGVHSNSGVPNKAFALMVDGGSFNEFTISALGIDKAIQVQYRALSNYLTSSSNFLDAYNALITSCNDLVGNHSITSDDCIQVSNAVQAVEMNIEPCYVEPPTPTTEVQDSGFESGSPNAYWVETSTNFGTPICSNVSCGGGTPNSGSYFAWFGGTFLNTEVGSLTQSVILDNSPLLNFYLTIPASGTTGYLRVKVDGTTLFEVTDSDAPSYQTYQFVSLSLLSFADGNSHNLQFESRTEIGPSSTNFFVDDITITQSTCLSSLSISNTTISDYKNYEVCGAVTIGPNVTITATGTLNITARDSIHISPDFNTINGGSISLKLNSSL